MASFFVWFLGWGDHTEDLWEDAFLWACPRRTGLPLSGQRKQSHLGPTLKTRLVGDPLKTPKLFARSQREGRYPRGAAARSLV